MSSSSERKIGRYQVKKKLGEGAMAIVVLAYDPVFKRDVALKVLHRRLARNDEIRKRFLREARAIAQIDHPAIVPIYDAGQDGNFVYYVMRMMEGETLFDRVSARPLTIEESLPVMQRVTSALDAAHENGFIHRDVKPENILFDRYDAAYLADFGILKQSDADANLTQNKLLGTPAYMSPEQVKGEDVTPRSDIYSLGAVLFEMFTGELPFEADTAMSMAMKHITEPVPRLRERNAKLPKQVEQIVAKAMAKEPAERFESGAELLSALRRIARPGTRTTSSGDILLPYNGSRQRLWIGVIGLLLVASLAWGAFTIFGAGNQSAAAPTQSASELAALTATAQYFAEQSDLLYTQEAIYLEETVTAVYESALADAGGGINDVETAVAATLAALEPTGEAGFGSQVSETSVSTDTATPAPSETPQPTAEPIEPTEIPTEVSQEIPAVSPTPPMLIVRTSSANARRGPGTVYGVVAVVLADEAYEIIGRNSKRDWYEVVLKNGQVGWVAASAALVDPEAADVAIGNIPPAPTSTRIVVLTPTPNFAATQTRAAEQTRSAGQTQARATQTRQAQVDNFSGTQTAQAQAAADSATRTTQAQIDSVAATGTAAANSAAWQATQTAQARPTATPRPTIAPVPTNTPTPAALPTVPTPTVAPTKEATGPLELFFSYGSCRYEGIDYLCDLTLSAKGGAGGPYTISVFDADPPKEYTTNESAVHVFRARRCTPWIHEVRVLDTQSNETISQNLFFDPNAHGGFPDGKCVEPE